MSVLVNIKHPTINVLKDDNNGHYKGCRLVEITEGANKVTLHFENPEDAEAWKGTIALLEIPK